MLKMTSFLHLTGLFLRFGPNSKMAGRSANDHSRNHLATLPKFPYGVPPHPPTRKNTAKKARNSVRESLQGPLETE